MEHLKYPIGKFEFGRNYSRAETDNNILEIANFPKRLISLALKLTDEQLELTYRPEGWNARQVIHHIADSHMNAYICVKLALTEDSPVIKPYKEALWANLEDGKYAPIEYSLILIEAIHKRWIYLLQSLSEKEFQRTYMHPEYNREFRLDEFIALYAWHGNHHYAHLKIILEK